MKKSIAVTVAVLAGCSALALLGGCNLALGRTAHTWEEAWSNAQLSDGTYSHWHACLDENCISRDQYARCTFEVVEETTPSTCSVAGVGKYECTVCGNVVTMPLPLAAHEWEVVYRQMGETCFTNGYGQWKCAECGIPRNDAGYDSNGYGAIPATGEHSLSEDWVYDESGHWHACTNYAVGQNGIAVNCTYTADFAPHTEGEPVTVAATATRDGMKTWRCTDCGYVMRMENIPALNTPVDFEMEIKPEAGFSVDPVRAVYGKDEYDCFLYHGYGQDGVTERRYKVSFTGAKNAAGEEVSLTSWSWNGSRGIRVYTYSDVGEGKYTLVDLDSIDVKYFDYDGSLWFVSIPYGNRVTLVFRYVTMVSETENGKTVSREVVRAEKRFNARVISTARASAVSTLAPLPDPYTEKKRK